MAMRPRVLLPSTMAVVPMLRPMTKAPLMSDQRPEEVVLMSG